MQISVKPRDIGAETPDQIDISGIQLDLCNHGIVSKRYRNLN